MLLKEELVRVGLDAHDGEEALRKVAQGFVDAGYAKDSYPQAIVDREAVFPTALPAVAFDIAIPHCDPAHINEPAVSIVTLREPVELKMMGDPDTTLRPRVLFMLALEAHGQVEMLQRLMEVIQDQLLLEAIGACANAHELYALMAEKIG